MMDEQERLDEQDRADLDAMADEYEAFKRGSITFTWGMASGVALALLIVVTLT